MNDVHKDNQQPVGLSGPENKDESYLAPIQITEDDLVKVSGRKVTKKLTMNLKSQSMAPNKMKKLSTYGPRAEIKPESKLFKSGIKDPLMKSVKQVPTSGLLGNKARKNSDKNEIRAHDEPATPTEGLASIPKDSTDQNHKMANTLHVAF